MRLYRTLYARIALGFVAFLAAMLIVQAVAFVWVLARTDHAIPGGSAERYAQSVAIDLANELQRDQPVNLETYLRDEYPSSSYPFTVVLTTGQVIPITFASPPEQALNAVRNALQRRARLAQVEHV